MTRLMTAILPREQSHNQMVYVQAFLSGAIFILFSAVTYATFITHGGVENLAWAFLVVSVVIPLVTLFRVRVEQNQTLPRKLTNYWLVSAVWLFMLWGALFLYPTRWISVILFVSYMVLSTLLSQVMSQLSSSFFSDRDQKWQEPFLLTAVVAGAVSFGLLVRPWMILLANPSHLMLICAVAAFGGYWQCRRLSRFLEGFPLLKLEQNEELNELRDIKVLRQPLVLNIFTYRFLSVLISSLILYVLLLQSDRYFAQIPNALPSFFASLGAIIQLTSVGLLLFVVQPLIKRIGLNFGLLIAPILLGLLAISLIYISLSPDITGGIVMWLVVLMVAIDRILTDSSSEPTIHAIVQIFPSSERDKIRNGILGLSLPLGIGVAGIILLTIANTLNGRGFAILIIIACLSFVWAGSGWITFQRYGGTLRERLNRRMLDEVELSLDNAETVSHVERLIGTGSPAMIRLALNLLKQDEHPTYISRLVGLLNYRNENILTDVLQRIEDERLSNQYMTLTKLFERHHSGLVKGRILRTLSACNPEESSDFVQEYMDDPDQEVRLGSLVGLLKYGGLPGSVYAGTRLIEIYAEKDAESQLYTAKILQHVGAASFYQPLSEQLEHENLQVRLGALQAATSVVNKQLVLPIIKNLHGRQTRSAAISALLAHADYAVPFADSFLSNETDCSTAVKARLARVIGEIGNGDAQSILLKHLDHKNTSIRGAVLDALRHSQYSATDPAERNLIEKQMLTELQQAANIISIQRDIGTGAAMEPLNGALLIEQAFQRDRLFNLLTFLYDRETVWTANEKLSRAGGPRNTIADETLEVLLSDRHNQQLSPMLDLAASPVARLAKLNRWIDVVEPQSAVDQIHTLICDESLSSWVRANAIYSATLAHFSSLLSDIEICANSNSPLIRETANWSVGQFKEPTENKHMLMIEKVAILKAASIFKDTPANVLASVAAIVKEIPLEANMTFIQQGDPSTEMYLVVEGEVEAVINGKSIIKLGQGQTVGELGIFNQELRSSDVRTLTPTLLFSIERDALNQLMADRPEIAQGIIGALSRRIRDQGQLMSQGA